jgi:excisionase family DNA binding protein
MPHVQTPSASLVYTMAELAVATGLGRSSLYAAIKSGQLTARKAGRRTIVLRADLDDFLRALPTISTAGVIG